MGRVLCQNFVWKNHPENSDYSVPVSIIDAPTKILLLVPCCDLEWIREGESCSAFLALLRSRILSVKDYVSGFPLIKLAEDCGSIYGVV